MQLNIFLILISASVNFVWTSNVLMVLPLGSRSHKNLFVPVANSLSKTGHDVTLISLYPAFKEEDPLYNDVYAASADTFLKEKTGEFNVFKTLHSKSGDANAEIFKKLIVNFPGICEAFLNDPAVQTTLKKKPDLILLPSFMNECGLIIVEKFKVPFIYVTPSGLTSWTSDLVGNPENPSYVPNAYLPFTDNMNFWQRMKNFLVRFAAPALRQYFLIKPLNNVAEDYLLESDVSLAETESKVSFIFVNSHSSLGYPRPLAPNVIEIGGLHCRDVHPIPETEEDLNNHLESSEEGKTIVITFGSVIKSSEMPIDLKNTFINAFARLPEYKFIWKYEGNRPENLTENVYIQSWLPQQDLLGHSSVGALFTHGGLSSTQEAVYHGVPIIGLPLMSDQFLNVDQTVAKGIATKLNIHSLTEEDIIEAVTTVMENPSYKDNAKRRSKEMRDQLTTPLDRAVYATEYVLRHNGADHLSLSSRNMSFIKYLCLDVIVVLSIIISVSILIIYFVCKKLVRFGWSSARTSEISYQEKR